MSNVYKIMLSISLGMLLSFIIGNAALDDKKLENFLESIRGEKIVFVINPGNAGDSLIMYGTLCLFKKMDLNFKISSKDEDILNADVVMYSGGGNLVPYYFNCANFLEKYANKVKHLVILPHTIQGHEKILKDLPKTVTIFCREELSYNYCKNIVSHPENVYISHDLAFYSDLEAYKNIKISNTLEKPKVLYSFRVDGENSSLRNSIVLPESNIDISSVSGGVSPDSMKNNMFTVERFLKRINEYDVVWTDRLHVGIGAFLLNKKVYLFDNSYGKIKAVYERTLRDMDVDHKIEFYGTDFSRISQETNG